ncbi:MAG: cobalamin-dependent protein [Candidatus Bathyarchaeota archaeon]|nr:cobalamin-dependent protein [Candidatus Bathyarchaeota archaeon]
MKVLLIQTPLLKTSGLLAAFPLGLAYLADALKSHEVTVIDPNTSESPFETVKKAIAKINPDIIGLSLRNIDSALSSDNVSFFEGFQYLLQTARENCSGAKIVVGGTGFSIFPNEIMNRCKNIDLGLFLEGEASFPQLLDNLDCPERVKGIYYRKNGKIHFSGKNGTVDFDSLAFPPRELHGLDLDCYRKIPHSMGIQTRRGCVFNCAYCTYPYLQGNCLRVRSPKKIVDEIENIVDNYGIEHFFFADTIFNYPFDHARQICREILKRKLSIRWSAWFKENYINKNFVIESQKSGCIGFEFSPDGASQSSLKILHKDLAVQDIKRVCKLIREVEEARVIFNFLRNVPGENLKSVTEFHKLLSWILATNRRQISFIGLNSIRIYPHTEIYNIALRNGVISRGQDLIEPTFYDPFPMSAAYFPVRCANYVYLRARKLQLFK